MSEENETKPRRRQRKQILSVAQRRMRRTEDLEEEFRLEFIDAILKGMSEQRACALVKFTYSHFVSRKKLANEYLESGMSPTDHPLSNIEVWAEFIEDIEQARAMHELNLIEDALDIESCPKKKAFWTRNVTILERRNRIDWGKNESMQHIIGEYSKDDRFL